MLRIEKLTKRFGATVAVDDVTVSISSGAFIGVIGRSGAGKSTLLRMINRLTEPTSGRIAFGDQDVTTLSGRALNAWRARAAMVFQQFNLVGRLDVLTNVLLGRLDKSSEMKALLGLWSREDKAIALTALELLEISGLAAQRAEQLSGGQQQRVAIARALAQEPDLILADEPIASLDPHNTRIVMDALKRLNTELAITVICNLHSVDLARSYAGRLIGMSAGRIVFDGPPAALTNAVVAQIYGIEAGDVMSLGKETSVPAAAPERSGAGADVDGVGDDYDVGVIGWATCFQKVRQDVAAILLAHGATLNIWSAIALDRADNVRELITGQPSLLGSRMSRNQHRRTPLHHAALKDRPGILRLLLELGADPMATDAAGATPLTTASQEGAGPAVIEALLSAGAPLDLLTAINLGRYDEAEAMLRDDPARIGPEGRDTIALHLAVNKRNAKAVRWLIAHGVAVSVKRTMWDCNHTALHMTVENGSIELANLLLDAGADPNVRDDKYNATALGWAQYFGRENFAALIKARGGQP